MRNLVTAACDRLVPQKRAVCSHGSQIRAARALLGWRQEDLSKASGVGTATIHRIEKSEDASTGYVSTVMRIQPAFEDAGVLFIEDDELGGIGLRLSKKKRRR
jgi:transcriptional regulator with XRE-family HTH domain